jgi:AcrR family transcriptional regulator
MKPATKQRAAALLQAALHAANTHGWHTLTHESIAAQAEVSPSLVKVRLGTIVEVRRAVMRAAVKQRVLRVVAEGLIDGDRAARRADAALRAECGEWVASA